MLTLRDYQQDAHSVCVSTLLEHGGSGLLMGCGLGKTAVTLRAIDTLSLVAPSPIKQVLVTAPIRVMGHWQAEQKAWGTKLPVRLLDGSPTQRSKLLKTAFSGITVISHDMLRWLAVQKPALKFDLLVIDEGSKFRTWMTKRTRAARAIALRSTYRMLLTGTPCPNGSGEIFAQQFILDLGKNLGTTVGSFRNRFMFRGGYENREWIFDPAMEPTLQKLIRPYYLRQSASDFLDIPAITHTIVKVRLPAEVLEQYKRFETELVAELFWTLADKQCGTNTKLLAFSGSDKYRLCRQMASGIAYIVTPMGIRDTTVVHKAKMNAVDDLLPELDGPVLVAYQFISERDLLLKRFPYAKVICGGSGARHVQDTINLVKRKKVRMVLVQNQAVSHGIDGLQLGCHNLIWFTLPDSGETYEQLIARLHRSGQTKPVVVHYLQAVGTIDACILRMLKDKQFNQERLLKGLQNENQLLGAEVPAG